MKHLKLLITLFVLALFVVACGAAGGDEPGALPDDSVGGEPGAAPETEDPDTPVSSEDPTPEPEEDAVDEGDVITATANITGIEIVIMESWPLQAQALVHGELGDGCTELDNIETVREDNTFYVTITTVRPADAVCTMQLKVFTENIPLDIVGLPAGTYTVDVNGVTETFELAQDNLPGTAEEEPSGVELPEEDQAELMRLTLERALVDQEIPDYALLADQAEIVLSTENINASLVPELDGVDLVLMTPEEIQARADEQGDFPYLQFDRISAESANSATVSLGSRWAISADSEMLYLSGGGFEIAYTRTAEGWQGEIVSQWIS